jgi:hypothetical protein
MTISDPCRHDNALRRLTHDTHDHRVYGTCEACEYARPVRCECGFVGCCGVDGDEHLVAANHLPGHHSLEAS